jgi:transglutaminase superfamily protein
LQHPHKFFVPVFAQNAFDASYRGSQSVPLLDGDRGTAQTIAVIRKLVDQALKDPFVHQAALSIVGGAQQYDESAEAQQIFAWVLQNIRYTRDPVGKEVLRPARVILQLGAGDCDDINGILLPSLLGVVGIETRVVTIASNIADPNQFSHIYCEALVDGAWIPLDAARSGTAYGSAPPNFYRKRVWSLADAHYQDVSGMGDCNCAHGRRAGVTGLAGYGSLGDVESEIAQDITAFAPIAATIPQDIYAAGAPPLTPFSSITYPYSTYNAIPTGSLAQLTATTSLNPTTLALFAAAALALIWVMKR